MGLLTFPLEDAINKIKSKDITIGVIGLGKIGSVILSIIGKAGFRVIGVDLDESLVDVLKSGVSPFNEPGLNELLQSFTSSERVTYTSKLEETGGKVDFYIVIIPIQTHDTGDINLHPLYKLFDQLIPIAKQGSIISIESTLLPDSLEKYLSSYISNNFPVQIDKDIGLGVAPEFGKSGRLIRDICDAYPKFVGGIGEMTTELMGTFYDQIINQTVFRLSPSEASAIKLFDGTIRYTSIAVVNEAALYCQKLGLDVWSILEKKYMINAAVPSHLFYKPGPGVGGHCLPVYNRFFTEDAKKYGVDLPINKAAAYQNNVMPVVVAQQILRSVIRLKKQESNILLLGLSFREGGVREVSHSPTLDVLKEIVGLDLTISISDPFFTGEEIHKATSCIGSPNWEQFIDTCDVIVLLVEYQQFAGVLSWIKENKESRKILIDTRGMFREELHSTPISNLDYHCLGTHSFK